MAKKKTTTRRRKSKSEPNVRWLLNTPPELREWATEQAERQGISRDAFMRLLIRTAKASWDESPNAADALFDDLRGELEHVVRDAIAEAIKQQPENTVRRRMGGKRR